jgi:hypothetical protein
MENAQEASELAVHKAKSAQLAIELARQAQQNELVEKTVQKTKEALLEGLKEVFTNDAERSPQEMRVLIQRVPIICTSIMQMHDDIKDLKDSQKWAVRVILGAIILAIMKLILIP